MKIPKFIKNNKALKITSLNAVVISVRLLMAVFVQRLLAVTVGEAGIATIGQIRNVMAMLMSTSTFGIFNGVVKYVAEYKSQQSELVKVCSTAMVFLLSGALLSGAILFFGASQLSVYIFNSSEFVYIFQLLAVVVPFISVNRVLSAVVNGLSDYKKYAKIELISYLIATIFMIVGLFKFDIKGVIIAIAIAPVIQLIVLIFIFGKTLRDFIQLKDLRLGLSYKKKLLAFTLMSFVSSFLINYVELDVRRILTRELTINEAGYWTAMTFISKNYMVFATGLFTLYVLPKFATINNEKDFRAELFHIYKSILPLFAIGMLLVYLFRNIIIQFIYPQFLGMEPLFKWQLLGDFIRLCALVLAHQFLAKKLVRSFIATEIISLALFYGLSRLFIQYYDTEGVVIAHFLRYIIYLIVVIVLVNFNFKEGNLKLKD